MCNYEEIIAYKSKKEGIQQGYTNGLIDNSANNVFNCMKSLGISLDNAIDVLKIDDSIKDKVIEEVNKMIN